VLLSIYSGMRPSKLLLCQNYEFCRLEVSGAQAWWAHRAFQDTADLSTEFAQVVIQASRFALASFAEKEGRPFLGLVIDEKVQALSALNPRKFSTDVTLLGLLENWAANLVAIKALLAGATPRHTWTPITELRACAPLPDARQVFCTGANYRRHVVEMIVAVGLGTETDAMDPQTRRAFGEAYAERQRTEAQPYVFMKPVTSIAGPCDDLVLPSFSEKTDWEIELGAVIGRDTLDVGIEDALSYIAGYMVVNDLTARDRVRRTDPGAIGPDWIAAKGAPGFLPTGPLFVPAEFVSNPQDLKMRLTVNGQVMQESSTNDMTFDIARQVAFISRYVQMLPGDILCTGSPAGNGVARGCFLKHGDVMEAEIEGLGRQIVRCVTKSQFRRP
jgi:2,4-diketo-3-deoxy-L-fuconate hydrolase